MENNLEQISSAQKDSWDKFSPGWEKWDNLTMGFLGPYGDKMIELLNPNGSDHVLDVAAGQPHTEDTVEARRILVRCEEIVDNDLTSLQRRIFHLKHLRQQPIRAIAQALGKSEDAIKANLYRMRRAISDGTPGLEKMLRS